MRQPVDSYLHGVLDYTTGALLCAVGRLPGVRGTFAGPVLRTAGVGTLAYSALTDYELGVARKVPYPLHLVLDAASALTLLGLGLARRSPLVAGAGLLEVGAIAISDPSGRGA